MRVTANMSADISLYNIQQQRSRIDSIVEKLTANQNIVRPSDNPVSSGILLDIKDKTKAYDQYATNITKTQTWLEFTGNAITGLSSILNATRQLNSSGSSLATITDPLERQMAHDSLVELKQQFIDIANIQYGDQYVFGGGNNLVPPFSQETGVLAITGVVTMTPADTADLADGMSVSGIGIPSGSYIASLNLPPGTFQLVDSAGVNVAATAGSSTLNFYAGDGTQREVEISTNIRQTISTTGDRLLLGIGSDPSYGTTNILQTFDSLIAAVGDATTPSDSAAVYLALADLELSSKQVITATASNIGRVHRVDNMAKLNELNKTSLTSIADTIQNVDLAKYGMQLNIEKTAFEASLSATARVSQMSLLDYI